MRYIWIISSIINAVQAGLRTFEKELSNDIWHHRYRHEIKRRKALH